MLLPQNNLIVHTLSEYFISAMNKNTPKKLERIVITDWKSSFNLVSNSQYFSYSWIMKNFTFWKLL